MADNKGFLTIYGQSDNFLNNKEKNIDFLIRPYWYFINELDFSVPFDFEHVSYTKFDFAALLTML